MTRVLVTGATGALGLAVIEQLKTQGNHLIFATTSRTNVNMGSEVTILACDFRNQKDLVMAFDRANPDLLLHLGASFTENMEEAYRLNVAPAIYFLDLIKDKGLNTRVVLIGSAAEYGVIQPEDNPITEEQPLKPVSPYGISKAWQTQLLGLYANNGVDVICARIFNLFGEGVSDKLLPGRLAKQINAVKAGLKDSIDVGSLAAIRDYLSTFDAARQLLMIAERGVTGNVYHIGSGKPLLVRDFLMRQINFNGLSFALINEAPVNSNRAGYDVPVIFANMQKTQFLATVNASKFDQSL